MLDSGRPIVATPSLVALLCVAALSSAFVAVAGSAPGASAIAPSALGASAPAAPAGQSTAVPILVSTEWVAEHLHDPDVLLVHVAMLQMETAATYIPGAVALDYHAIETSEGLSIELPPAERLASVFGTAGVADDKHVVVYGGGAAHVAARAFMTLEYLGHRRVSMMDGGIEAWVHEGRPTSSTPAEPVAAQLTPRINVEVLADSAWIKAHLDDPDVAVIDARPASQFAGYSNRGLRPGHIPGAGNLYFVELLESEDLPRLKPRNEVEAMFAVAGYTPGATVVSYCQIGMRASYNYLVARHLGYDVKLYDGSWEEWGADESLPTETGPGR